jgi:hypothetical protein
VDAVQPAQTLRLIGGTRKQVELEVLVVLVHVLSQSTVERQRQVDLEVLQANSVGELTVASTREAVSGLFARDVCDVFLAILDVGEPAEQVGDAGEREVAAMVEELFCFGIDCSGGQDERVGCWWCIGIWQRKSLGCTEERKRCEILVDLAAFANAFQFLRGDRDAGSGPECHLVGRSSKLEWKFHEREVTSLDGNIRRFTSVRSGCDDVLIRISFRSRRISKYIYLPPQG